MEPLTAVIGIVAVFLLLALFIARSDGLAFLAPKSTRGIRASASVFCVDRCRVEGRCPMTETGEQANDCPLWKYVGADMPIVVNGSPFESLHAGG